MLILEHHPGSSSSFETLGVLEKSIFGLSSISGSKTTFYLLLPAILTTSFLLLALSTLQSLSFSFETGFCQLRSSILSFWSFIFHHISFLFYYCRVVKSSIGILAGRNFHILISTNDLPIIANALFLLPMLKIFGFTNLNQS